MYFLTGICFWKSYQGITPKIDDHLAVSSKERRQLRLYLRFMLLTLIDFTITGYKQYLIQKLSRQCWKQCLYSTMQWNINDRNVTRNIYISIIPYWMYGFLLITFYFWHKYEGKSIVIRCGLKFLVLLHDNVLAHTVDNAMNTLKSLLERPPYSPDLASSDYHLMV